MDREERPDVDRVYMSFVQATTGRGGWPMSVFLTPDLAPFYGGSYYPRKDMFQGGQLVMPAFTTVMRRIASMWDTNREDLMARGQGMRKCGVRSWGSPVGLGRLRRFEQPVADRYLSQPASGSFRLLENSVPCAAGVEAPACVNVPHFPHFPTLLQLIPTLSTHCVDIMQRLSEALGESSSAGAEAGGTLQADLAEHAVFTCKEQLARRFDARLGGFGGEERGKRGGWAEAGVTLQADLAEHAVFTCKEQVARRFDARLG